MPKQPPDRLRIPCLRVDDAGLCPSQAVGGVFIDVTDLELTHPRFDDSGIGVDADRLFGEAMLLPLENEILVRRRADQMLLDAVLRLLTEGQLDGLLARLALLDLNRVPWQPIGRWDARTCLEPTFASTPPKRGSPFWRSTPSLG